MNIPAPAALETRFRSDASQPGRGRRPGFRLFQDGSAPVSLTLVDSQAYANGVLSLTYRPSGADKR